VCRLKPKIKNQNESDTGRDPREGDGDAWRFPEVSRPPINTVVDSRVGDGVADKGLPIDAGKGIPIDGRLVMRRAAAARASTAALCTAVCSPSASTSPRASRVHARPIETTAPSRRARSTAAVRAALARARSARRVSLSISSSRDRASCCKI
jgi:hypothetical protein